MSEQQSALAGAAPAAALAPNPLRLGVLTNPLSTRNRAGLAKFRAVLSRYPTIPHIELEDWSRLRAATAELASRGVDAIAVNGGDGTVIGLLTELRRRSPFAETPALVVLAAGNTNMIAGDVGLAGAPHRALTRFLAVSSSGSGLKREERRLIRVEQEGEATDYGLFVGAIAIVRTILLARRMLHPLGVKHGFGNAAGMGLGVLRVLYGRDGREGLLAGVPVEIGFDDEPMRCHDYAAVMATTLERLMFGIRPFWGAESGAIRTTLVRAPADRPLRSLLPMLRGRPTERMNRAGYLSRNAERVKLALDGPFMIDGEIRQARRERPVVLSDGGVAVFWRC